MNNDKIIELAKKCNGELTTYDHEPLSYTFAIANLEAFVQAVIEDYKASLVPVAFHIGNEDGSYSRIGATYNNESTAKNHIASYKGELVACVVPLYALSNHDDTW